MPDKPVSPLRQRMIDDMTARRFTEDPQRDYVRAVKNFTVFLGRSPDKASAEDLRRYQLHLAKQHIGPATINQACTALRFFFKITLEKPDLVRAPGAGAAAAQDAGRSEPGRGGPSHS
jgi:site-specific recombinase XerD